MMGVDTSGGSQRIVAANVLSPADLIAGIRRQPEILRNIALAVAAASRHSAVARALEDSSIRDDVDDEFADT